MNPHTYAFKILYALDVFVASLLFRDAAITISSYCGLALRYSRPGAFERVKRGLGRCLNFVATDHCEKAIGGDARRAHEALRILGFTHPKP
jgi:hypothetical protein